MKIGILTLHASKNYGAVLQCYALLSYIKGHGHEAVVIDKPSYKTDFFHRIVRYRSYFKEIKPWKKFYDFSDIYLQPKTRNYCSERDLGKNIAKERFDAIIVGSDQVWRRIGNSIRSFYFLDFLPDDTQTKRYSYAASFGLSSWQENNEITKKIQNCVNRFDAISVREKTGVEICKNVFSVNAELVLDPTLLHDASFYNQLLPIESIYSNNFVVSYILGSEHYKQVEEILLWTKHKNCKYKELFYTKDQIPALKEAGIGHKEHISVLEWLCAIRDCKYVITNSFHATVFSILFAKNFVVLEHNSGGKDRIDTLLNALGLSNRFIKDTSGIDDVLNTPIDYSIVYKKLNDCRKKSFDFINSILGESDS